jgi:hypothetical protein
MFNGRKSAAINKIKVCTAGYIKTVQRVLRVSIIGGRTGKKCGHRPLY